MKYKSGEIIGEIIKHLPNGEVLVNYGGTELTLLEKDNEFDKEYVNKQHPFDVIYQQAPVLIERGIHFEINFLIFQLSQDDTDSKKAHINKWNFIESLPNSKKEVCKVPLSKIKPSQFDAQYLNDSSSAEAEEYRKVVSGEYSVDDVRVQNYYPILVNKRNGEILDGNHRHAALTLIGAQYAWVLYVDIPEEWGNEIKLAKGGAFITRDNGHYKTENAYADIEKRGNVSLWHTEKNSKGGFELWCGKIFVDVFAQKQSAEKYLAEMPQDRKSFFEQTNSKNQFSNIMLLPTIDEKRAAIIKYILAHPETKIIIAFSGGKDSIAMVLHLLELGISKSQIELWHHDVDGHAEELFDWHVTPEYCSAFADAMGIKLLFSYREGGIVKRLLRDNEPRGNVYYQTPDLQWHMAESNQAALNTGGRWPQKGRDLQSRWCSSEVKIDVASAIMANDERLNGTPDKPVEIVFCTGERHSESDKRATYDEMQIYKKGKFTVNRKTIAWRPIIEYSEEQVWELLKKWNIQPHPCYYLNWGRCSCQLCIFNESPYWATILQINPEKVVRMRQLEIQTARFVVNQGKEHTLYHKMDIYEKCDAAPVINVDDAEVRFWIKQATEQFTLPIFVQGEWKLPGGAFKKENCGAS